MEDINFLEGHSTLLLPDMGRISKRKQRGFIGKKKWEVDEAHGNIDGSHFETDENGDTITDMQTRTASAEKLASSDFQKFAAPNRPATRGLRRQLGMLDSAQPQIEPAAGIKLQDFTLLQECLNVAAICASCKSSKSKLRIFQKNNEWNGLAETLFIRCVKCSFKSTFYTSNKIPGKKGKFEVNRRSALAFSNRQKLVYFCAKINLPPPIHKKPYHEHQRECEKIFVEETEKKMSEAATRLKNVVKNEEPEKVVLWSDGGDVTCISVTVDGTWQKRGHTSKIGAVFLLSVRTGEVLDYQVLSHVCYECMAHGNYKKDSVEYQNWWDSHAQVCQINHTGSSGDMETKGAITMFTRSTEKHRLLYTTFVGDGDSSSFGNVSRAVHKQFGDSYPISKEECVGHVQKRMGAALTEFKRKMKGTKLSDGKGVAGAGRLANQMIKKLQNYYGFAIRQNKGNLAGMKEAINAIKHHIIEEPTKPLAFQHRFCPKAKDSWCYFQRDEASETNSNHNAARLPHAFMQELSPIFDRLSNEDLLKRCLLGLTQNQNESLNGTLWTLIPKTLFLGKRQVTIGVCEAISVFNTGAAAKAVFMEKLGLPVGRNMLRALRREDNRRLRTAAQKATKKYKRRRKQIKFTNRTALKSSNLSYNAGSFGTDSVPENTCRCKKKSKKKGANHIELIQMKKQQEPTNCNKESLKIKFVGDEDVTTIPPFKRKKL